MYWILLEIQLPFIWSCILQLCNSFFNIEIIISCCLHGFFSFKNVIIEVQLDIQCTVSGVQQSDSTIIFIPQCSPHTIGEVTVCHYKHYLNIVNYKSYTVLFIPMSYSFYKWKFLLLNHLHLFSQPLPFSPVTTISCLYLWVCFCFLLVLFFRFHI